jgi:hypothetical protein
MYIYYRTITAILTSNHWKIIGILTLKIKEFSTLIGYIRQS